MNEGIVVRNVVWKSPKGKEVKATFKRLVSLADKNIMAIQIKITPINFEGTVKFSSYVEAGVENHTRKTNPLVDYGPFGKHLVVDLMKIIFYTREKQRTVNFQWLVVVLLLQTVI